MRGEAMLTILILADDRPGHYHLSEGVAAALARRAHVTVERVSVTRRRGVPRGILRPLLGRATADWILRLGYGLRANDLPAADLVVSAGGDTLIANVAVAAAQGIPNIFCGTLRAVPAGSVSLVVSSYAEHRDRPDHLVTLKPSTVDPGALGRPLVVPTFSSANPPPTLGLLVGGPSGLFSYADDEWQHLIATVRAVHASWGSRWLISTSRRTPAAVADAFAALAVDTSAGVAEFIDYRSAGPGTLTHIFAHADAILCTEDSSTMISEAVAARLPVVGVAPRDHGFKPEEAGYRALMRDRGWARFVALAELAPATLGAAMAQLTPLDTNPLDRLADDLATRLVPLLPTGALATVANPVQATQTPTAAATRSERT